MATNSEEILLRMGLDSTAVATGFKNVAALSKKAADDQLRIEKELNRQIQELDRQQTAFDKKQSDLRIAQSKAEADEKIAQDRRVANARQNISNQIANARPNQIPIEIQKAERDRINAEIAAGSGGQGWLKGAEEGAGMAGGAAAGGAALKQITGNRSVMMQLGHSVRAVVDMMMAGQSPLRALALEAPRVSQALASAGLTLSGLWRGLLRVGGAAVGAGLGLFDVYKLGKEAIGLRGDRANEADSATALYQQRAKMGFGLLEQINQSEAMGAIDAEKAQQLRAYISGSKDQNKVRTVQRTLLAANSARINDNAGAAGMDEERGKELEKLAALQAKERSIAEIKADSTALLKEKFELDKKINDFAVKGSELAAAELRSTQIQVQLEKNKTEEKQKQAQADSLRKEYAVLMAARGAAGENYNAIGKATPTLEQLAGRDYLAAQSEFFGQGGAMDLDSGTGPLAAAAQDALFYRNKQIYDYTQGNSAAAEMDRRLQNAAENKLGAAGLSTPEMRQKEMLKNLADMNTAITELNDRAKGVGINLAVPN